MILFIALKMCLDIRPHAIYKEDILTKFKNNDMDDTLWELRIYFLQICAITFNWGFFNTFFGISRMSSLEIWYEKDLLIF